MTVIEKLKLIKNLKAAQALPRDTIPQRLARIKAIKAALDALKGAKTEERTAEKEAVEAAFKFDAERKTAERKKANDAAYALLQSLDEGKTLTEEEKAVLAAYSGCGGGLVNPLTGKTGSATEYYTPKPIVSGMWDMLGESFGFKGGKVLDPSSGTGIFGATAPKGVVMQSVEISEVSGKINKALNSKTGNNVAIEPFESFASRTPDGTFDALVTNVPFGDSGIRTAKGMDQKYQDQSLQGYFLLRGLDKLKPGGLMAVILPGSVVANRGARETKVRTMISLKAEFCGAIRLPNSVFETTGADVITDVAVFKKHGADAAEKIDALFRAGKADELREMGVLYEEFIDGNWFKGEGRKYLHGEEVTVNGRWGETQKVVSTKSVTEIGPLLRELRFKSRINWDALGAADVSLAYDVGDEITAPDGTLMRWDGETFVEVQRAEAKVNPFAKVIEAMDLTALQFYYADFSDDEVAGALQYVADNHVAVKPWVNTLNLGKRIDVLVCAAVEAFDAKAPTDNLGEEHPRLTEDVQASIKAARNVTPKESAKGVYNRFKAFTDSGVLSPVWFGQVAELKTIESNAAKFEVAKGRQKWVSIDDMRKNGIDVDGEEFVHNGGMVALMDEVCTGKAAEVIDALKNADVSPERKARQLALAMERIERIDVSKMIFTLTTKYVSADAKAEFLSLYVSKSSHTGFQTNGDIVVLPASDVKYVAYGNIDRLFVRALVGYVNDGRVSFGNLKIDGVSDDEQKQAKRDLLDDYRKYLNKLDTQFNLWVHSNRALKTALDIRLNSAENAFFKTQASDGPLTIPGLSGDIQLHGYQRAFVRKIAARFNGINSFDVGLGKSFTALASVQYAQAIGAKKKTVFVVPKSVITNWVKEANRLFSADVANDILVVGAVEKKGKLDVDSKRFDADLQRIADNVHSKIFMTAEAFQRIRIREEDVKEYLDAMRLNDRDAYGDKISDADSNRVESRLYAIEKILTEDGKSDGAPYWHTLGIDSVVFDEMHVNKNAVLAIGVRGAKFLSLPPASKKAVDVMCKTWLIRRDHGAGVLGLTATPITNSPLEIYGMMSIVEGMDAVNDACGVAGPGDFIKESVIVENREELGVDGEERMMDVFVGLKNTQILARLVRGVCDIKTAADAGNIVQPDSEEVVQGVPLDNDTERQLRQMILAYQIMQGSVDAGPEIPEHVADVYGSKVKTLMSPLNLLSNMSKLMVDEDAAKKRTVYIGGSEELTEKFNALKIKEKRAYGPRLDASETVKVTANPEDEEDVEFIVQIGAVFDGKQTIIDTTSWETQDKFEALAAKLDVPLDVKPSEKFKALIENMKAEAANVRGIKNGERIEHAKQIVFCDMLATHNKLKRFICSRMGIPASEVIIVTGQRNGSPEEIQDVQDGFNDGRYRIIIANEKAEVGINLQKGTQAIHHLTIGWTPDSLQQRNGRGVRQGNETAKVNVYYYDAEGTFDQMKRSMVNKKADWIEKVMTGEGRTVAVNAGLTREQMDALIDGMGDAESIAKAQAKAEEKAKKAARDRAVTQQMIMIEVAQKSAEELKKASDMAGWATSMINKLLTPVNQQLEVSRKQLALSKSDKAKERLTQTIAELEKRQGEIRTRYRNYSDPTVREEWQNDIEALQDSVKNANEQVENLSGDGGLNEREIQHVKDGEFFRVGDELAFPGQFVMTKNDGIGVVVKNIRKSLCLATLRKDDSRRSAAMDTSPVGMERLIDEDKVPHDILKEFAKIDTYQATQEEERTFETVKAITQYTQVVAKWKGDLANVLWKEGVPVLMMGSYGYPLFGISRDAHRDSVINYDPYSVATLKDDGKWTETDIETTAAAAAQYLISIDAVMSDLMVVRNEKFRKLLSQNIENHYLKDPAIVEQAIELAKQEYSPYRYGSYDIPKVARMLSILGLRRAAKLHYNLYSAEDFPGVESMQGQMEVFVKQAREEEERVNQEWEEKKRREREEAEAKAAQDAANMEKWIQEGFPADQEFGITGFRTFGFKDRIKQAEQEAGGKARWHGDSKQWIIHGKALDKLFKDESFADAVNEKELIIKPV